MDEKPLVIENEVEEAYRNYSPKYLLVLLISQWDELSAEIRSLIVKMLSGKDESYNKLYEDSSWKNVGYDLEFFLQGKEYVMEG